MSGPKITADLALVAATLRDEGLASFMSLVVKVDDGRSVTLRPKGDGLEVLFDFGGVGVSLELPLDGLCQAVREVVSEFLGR